MESATQRDERLALTTTQDLAELMVKLAGDVELWLQYGMRPFVPEELLLAAERITTAMRVSRHNDMPLSQLVVFLARPGDQVTAPQMRDLLASHGHEVPVRAVSTALHRAASRGLFEHPARGIYRLVTPNLSGRRPGPEQPADTPRAPQITRSEHALVEVGLAMSTKSGDGATNVH